MAPPSSECAVWLEMETAPQRCSRLIAALEDLARQESAALAHGDYATVLALQERAEPLVACLISAGGDAVKPAGVEKRLGALHALRERTSLDLAEKLEAARRELQDTKVAQRRVARVAPVYGH